MKNFKFVSTLLFILAYTLVSADNHTANKIEFNMPEKFTDFSSDANRNAKDRENLMKQLSKLMSESISENSKNTFEITVNDIDMAGRFLLQNTEFLRIVDEFDRSRFEFSYRMMDSEGNEIKSGDVNLSDRNAFNLKNQSNKYKNTTFSNEMRMFDDWLKSL